MTALLEQVHEGMTVSDIEGNEIGTVDLVRMGDPDAETAPIPDDTDIPPATPMAGGAFMPGGTGSTTPGGAGPLGAGVPAAPVGATTGEEPDVPGEISRRLRRTGYFKVDSKGLFRRDVYVSANEIDRVSDDAVMLNVAKKELAKEA